MKKPTRETGAWPNFFLNLVVVQLKLCASEYALYYHYVSIIGNGHTDFYKKKKFIFLRPNRSKMHADIFRAPGVEKKP